MKQQLDRYFELLPLLCLIVMLVLREMWPVVGFHSFDAMPTGVGVELPRLILR